MSWSVTSEKDSILPEGYYQAVVEDLEKIDTAFGGERIIWKWAIPAKGAKWAKTILGINADKIDWGPDQLKGKPCTVYVEISEDKDGDERNIVTKVKPSRNAGKLGNLPSTPSDNEGDEDFNAIPF